MGKGPGQPGPAPPSRTIGAATTNTELMQKRSCKVEGKTEVNDTPAAGRRPPVTLQSNIASYSLRQRPGSKSGVDLSKQSCRSARCPQCPRAGTAHLAKEGVGRDGHQARRRREGTSGEKAGGRRERRGSREARPGPATGAAGENQFSEKTLVGTWLLLNLKIKQWN